MYLVAIAWIYVAVMMSLAEAFSSNGSVLGAVITFLLYGVLPVALLVYILGTPGRKRALREKEQAALAAASSAPEPAAPSAAPPVAAPSSGADPDGGGLTPADAVPAMRKEG